MPLSQHGVATFRVIGGSADDYQAACRSACLASLTVFGSAAAEPALWAIRDGKSTIYLFGTFHLLQTGTDWQSPKIVKAYTRSSEVWLELLDDDQATMQPLMAQLGRRGDRPLSRRLPVDELARLDKRAVAGIARREDARRHAPLGSTRQTLIAVAYQQAGFDPSAGAGPCHQGTGRSTTARSCRPSRRRVAAVAFLRRPAAGSGTRSPGGDAGRAE